MNFLLKLEGYPLLSILFYLITLQGHWGTTDDLKQGEKSFVMSFVVFQQPYKDHISNEKVCRKIQVPVALG